MKKLLLFFAAVMVAGSMMAGSYTITFANKASSATAIATTTQAATVISSSSTNYVTASPFSNLNGSNYYGDTKSCIRLGKSGEAGGLTIALSDAGKVNATSVTINCYRSGSKNASATIACNESDYQDVPEAYGDVTISLDGSEITSLVLSSTKAVYISSITVNYSTDEGGETGGETGNDEEESFVNFIFDTNEGLQALGITKPAASQATNLENNTYTSGSISLTATDGTSATRVWNSGGNTDLRIYKTGGSITLSGATIEKIEFTGSSLGAMTANVGAYTNPTWEGSASSVTFTATNTINIRTIKVYYAVASEDFTLTTEDTDFYGLYLENEVTIPEGIEAYTGVLNAEETELAITKIEGTVLPAQTPVIVKSSEAGEYTFVESNTAAAAIANNSLKGVSVETAVSDLAVEEGKTVLTLGAKDGVVGFRQPKGTSIKANRVYLLVNTPAEGAAPIRIVEATTAVENVEANDAVKFFENGQLLIKKNGVVYNVMGQIIK